MMNDFTDTRETPRLSLAIPFSKQKKKKKDGKQPFGADVRSAFGGTTTTPTTNDPSTDEVLIPGGPQEPLVIPAVPNKFGIAASAKGKPALSTADEEAIRALQAQAGGGEAAAAEGSAKSKDMMIQTTKDTFQRETQQFKADMEQLPDELDSEEYSRRVPIADFGAAMLRGMGWQDPAPDQKNKKEKSDEIMPRPQRLGLGAVPKMEEELPSVGRKRSLRPDQLKQRERLEEQRKEFAAERERQFALDKQRTMQDGSLISLRSGDRAKIIKLVGVPGLNMVKVWKENEGEASIVKRGEIEGLLSREELETRPYQHPVVVQKESQTLKKIKEEEKPVARDKRTRDNEPPKRDEGRPSKRSREEASWSSSSQSRRMTWVIPNIRVRVVTEKLGRKYFKEKGIVIDVTPKGATLRLDKSGTVLDRVPEDYLETALPKPGGKAIVLAGSNKYAKGKLLERNSKSGKGIIQIFEDMSVLSLSLDDIAEYVGALDDAVEE